MDITLWDTKTAGKEFIGVERGADGNPVVYIKDKSKNLYLTLLPEELEQIGAAFIKLSRRFQNDIKNQ
jgi:hypothetical protein